MWFTCNCRHKLYEIVKKAMKEVLFSKDFANHLRRIIEQTNDASLKEIIQQYVYKNVEVTTTSGAMIGTVTGVFDDYFSLQESANTYLFIPYHSVSSIRST